jgi:anti-sigma B factor antagonist
MSSQVPTDDQLDRTQSRPFGISEEDVEPGCREVRIEGELDLAVVDQLCARLEAALAADVEVLVSLERCDFIDSTGLAAIVRARRQLAEKGRRLAICSPSPGVSRTLQITGLDLASLLYPTVEAALAGRDADPANRMGG